MFKGTKPIRGGVIIKKQEHFGVYYDCKFSCYSCTALETGPNINGEAKTD